jgi:hypothetical protein
MDKRTGKKKKQPKKPKVDESASSTEKSPFATPKQTNTPLKK